MKFMLSLNGELGEELQRLADEKQITIQELLRAVVIPDWVRGYVEISHKFQGMIVKKAKQE